MIVALFHPVNGFHLAERRRNQLLVVSKVPLILQADYINTVFNEFIQKFKIRADPAVFKRQGTDRQARFSESGSVRSNTNSVSTIIFRSGYVARYWNTSSSNA